MKVYKIPRCGQNRTSSVGLLSPGHVVGTWHGSGQRGDDALEPWPEVDHLEGVVEPAGSDAEVGVVWRHMVDAVVTSWQQDVDRLQEHDGTRQAKVRVRPFVNLSHTHTHKDVLFLALDWQRIGQRPFTLWHTASLYCHHVTSGYASSVPQPS